WVKIGPGVTRAVIRAKYPKGSTVSASPVVYPILAYGEPNADGSMPADGSVRFLRADNADSDAAGLTLTLTTGGNGLMVDDTYAYSDPVSLTAADLLGADYLGVVVGTAANVGGAGAVPIEVLLLNWAAGGGARGDHHHRRLQSLPRHHCEQPRHAHRVPHRRRAGPDRDRHRPPVRRDDVHRRGVRRHRDRDAPAPAVPGDGADVREG